MAVQGEAPLQCLMPIGLRVGRGGPPLFILPEILPPEASIRSICTCIHHHNDLEISSFMISFVPP